MGSKGQANDLGSGGYYVQSPHRAFRVMYNGKGKHDKIYIVGRLTRKDDNFTEDVFGFYRARKATKWNVSLIASSINPQWTPSCVDNACRRKVDKGYEVLTEDKHLSNIGLPALQPLAAELCGVAGAFVAATQVTPVEVEQEPPTKVINTEYECVDDFGVKGQFSIGCIYVGHPYNSTMLSVENDQGTFVNVDKELFKEVG